MKKCIFFLVFFTVFSVQAQLDSLRFKKKKFLVKDSIVYHNVSTNPFYFKVFSKDRKEIDSSNYQVNYAKSLLIFNKELENKLGKDSIEIRFFLYPEFLTKTYRDLDPSIIEPDNPNAKPVSIFKEKKELTKPFSGLDTKGNITRGVTVGNNQDAVLNSVLDLQIEGKIASNVSLRARINDTNIPIQEGGYSQDLKDLDRVYIEMTGENWGIRAGDVFLKNSETHFMNFNKKVSGVSVNAKVDSTSFFTSGALVKGHYTSQSFQGIEANQGPYKLQGQTGESFIFIISDSEKVFINGTLQARGVEQDYVIDYNTAEITFTPTNPITSDMRIRVEYQYSDRNYTRFMTHNGGTYNGEKLQIGAYFYRESDVKTQPLQISLTDEQRELLSQMGTSSEQIFVENAVVTDYDTKKILYKKLSEGIFESSTDETETLYQVSFTYFGTNQGDYEVETYLAIGKKMHYVGENQGDYKAVIPLVAPTKQQVMAINSSYKPNDKTAVSVELAYSDNDQNLFSSLDNATNKAPAIKANLHQVLLDTTTHKWRLDTQLNFDFLHRNFKSVERLYQVEFDRDWNLTDKTGNQRLLSSRTNLSNSKHLDFFYTYENLNLSGNYNGNKHGIGGYWHNNTIEVTQESSYLESQSLTTQTAYARSLSRIKYYKPKFRVGGHFDFEKNEQKTTNTSLLSDKSFQFSDFHTYIGVGDTTQVFTKFGATFHANDSLVVDKLQAVNRSETYFVKSQLIHSEQANLQLYTNYRKVFHFQEQNTESINAKLTYNQQLFNQFLSIQTRFENTSGTLAQQEYTYIETEPGQGYYTWIDYNGNGIQDLDEFEVAQFSDQASFLRIALPNIHYIPTQEAFLQQRVQLNFSKWNAQKGMKKFLSFWYNDFSILAKNNSKRGETLINLKPFDFENPNTLAMQYNIRNNLIFNRGKSHYTTAYLYNRSRNRIIQTFGTVETSIALHHLSFQHLIKKTWQLGLLGEALVNATDNETFSTRNYTIETQRLAPNLSYFFSKTHWIKTTYSVTNKQNSIGDLEHLNQQELGLNYNYSNDKQTTFIVELKAIQNQFTGNSYSAVGFQMLEGLQPDNNMTWLLLWRKKINSFMFLDLTYNGRANTFTKTIHNGNVALKAIF